MPIRSPYRGHSSIVITMRYVHPQADASERAFLAAYGKAKAKRTTRRVGHKKWYRPEGRECSPAQCVDVDSRESRNRKGFQDWCREGESNPQGPKPGGF